MRGRGETDMGGLLIDRPEAFLELSIVLRLWVLGRITC